MALLLLTSSVMGCLGTVPGHHSCLAAFYFLVELYNNYIFVKCVVEYKCCPQHCLIPKWLWLGIVAAEGKARGSGSVEEMLPMLEVCEWASVVGGRVGQFLFVF